jgi:hypothetical protein
MVVLIVLSCYENNVAYEESFYIGLRRENVYTIGKRENAFEFTSIEEIEKVLTYFANGDFSYAFVKDGDKEEISYYIRHNIRKC